MEDGERPDDRAVRIPDRRRPARPESVLKCDVATVCPYWVRLDVDRVDGATEVSRCCARPMGQANLKAVTGAAIGRWNGRSGTNDSRFPSGLSRRMHVNTSSPPICSTVLRCRLRTSSRLSPRRTRQELRCRDLATIYEAQRQKASATSSKKRDPRNKRTATLVVWLLRPRQIKTLRITAYF